MLGLTGCKKTPASPQVTSTGPTVSTVVGSGSGFADGPVASALFSAPSGVAVDAQGALYVADYGNSRLRKVLAGQVTTFPSYYLPGTGIPLFDLIGGVTVDARGTVYVSDRGYTRNVISTVSATGTFSTLAGNGVAGFADGNGTGVKFNAPVGLAVDGRGVVYVADSQNHRIRKITPDGTVSTVAGTGVAGFADGTSAAQFNLPTGVAVDGQGVVYVADTQNHRIRKITPAGIVTTLAGNGLAGFTDGSGTGVKLNAPLDVAVDGQGVVYVADSQNHRIRKITSDGTVSTVAGTGVAADVDGSDKVAAFDTPCGITVDGQRRIYVADLGNRIRLITP